VETGRTIRGKIDLAATAARALLVNGQVQVRFAELTHDVLPNRILRTTMGMLVRTRGLDGAIRRDLHGLWAWMPEVSELQITQRCFRQVQLHRNNAGYRLLMMLCELAVGCLLPDEVGESYRFRDFTKNHQVMAKLFQSFVKRFLQVHTQYKVTSSRVSWDSGEATPVDHEMMPGMLTDVTLIGPSRCFVIDTKYYRSPFQVYNGKTTFISSHIYQMMAYLKNMEVIDQRFRYSDGIILYAKPEGEIQPAKFQIWGHKVSIEYLNLSQELAQIEHQLKQMVS